jgi:hypothetical protein
MTTVAGARFWQTRTALVVVISVVVVLVLPAAMYAYLSYAKFGLFKPSYYIPYEALFSAFETSSFDAIWSASLIVVNMTSGLLLSNMYTLTISQLVLSTALGVFIGLNLAAHGALQRSCPLPGRTAETAGAAGTGLFATVAASSTGIVGCCGSALGGGVLALAGLSSMTAVQIAGWSPYLQTGLIVLFMANYIRLRRRIRARLS